MFRILFTLFILVGAIMPAQAGSTFTNPILSDGADPWVVRHDDGFYYYTQTTGNDITLWRTRDIADLEHAERKVVWMPPQGAVNGSHIWAPELHRLDGRWYIYFAASAGDMARQRMYVLQSEGDDPFGSYAFPQDTAPARSPMPATSGPSMAQCWNTRASAISSGRAGRGTSTSSSASTSPG